MCPERDILSAYVDGEVPSPWDRAIADHVAGCESCRSVTERLEHTRRTLRADDPFDWQGARERVRLRIATRVAAPIPVFVRPTIWRRQVSIPLPVAVLAAGLVIALGITLATSLTRSNFGMVRITKAPAGTEIQIAAPISDLESLLAKMGGDSSQESVLTLPKNVRLVPVGEPRMGLEGDFSGKKP